MRNQVPASHTNPHLRHPALDSSMASAHRTMESERRTGLCVDQSFPGTLLVKRQRLERTETSTPLHSFYLPGVSTDPLVLARKREQLGETDSVVEVLCLRPLRRRISFLSPGTGSLGPSSVCATLSNFCLTDTLGPQHRRVSTLRSSLSHHFSFAPQQLLASLLRCERARPIPSSGPSEMLPSRLLQGSLPHPLGHREV